MHTLRLFVFILFLLAGVAQAAQYGRSSVMKPKTVTLNTTTADVTDADNIRVVNGAQSSITALTPVEAGRRVLLHFAGTTTVVHNASTLVLDGSVNFSGSAGKLLMLYCDGTKWYSLSSPSWMASYNGVTAGVGGLAVLDDASVAAVRTTLELDANYAPTTVVTTHVAASDPHTQYILAGTVTTLVASSPTITISSLDLSADLHYIIRLYPIYTGPTLYDGVYVRFNGDSGATYDYVASANHAAFGVTQANQTSAGGAIAVSTREYGGYMEVQLHNATTVGASYSIRGEALSEFDVNEIAGIYTTAGNITSITFATQSTPTKDFDVGTIVVVRQVR